MFRKLKRERESNYSAGDLNSRVGEMARDGVPAVNQNGKYLLNVCNERGVVVVAG